MQNSQQLAMARKPKYNEKMVKKITDLIESDDYTISEICKRVGIHDCTYYEWQADETKPEFSDAIKKAQENRLEVFRQAARRGLRILLEGKEWEETTTEGRLTKTGDGKEEFKTTKAKKVKKFILPNPVSVIFALKNLDAGNFADIIRHMDIPANKPDWLDDEVKPDE